MNSVGSWDKEREDGPLILDLLLLFYGLQFEVVVSECLGGESRSIDPDLWPPLETPPPPGGIFRTTNPPLNHTKIRI